jgi:RNA polymerase sigma-70 factor (ECF subfamily)
LTSLQFKTFDDEYVRRLAAGDSAAGEHFASYFAAVLYLKLRMRLWSRELIEDVRQETLLRVLVILRQPDGVRRPERFGALVNSVCNNVIKEFCRLDRRYEPWDEFVEEPADTTVNLDAPLLNEDLRREIWKMLKGFPEKKRAILKAIYLDEMDKDEVCRLYHVDAGYLRVLLHRARIRFRKVYGRELPGASDGPLDVKGK